MFELTTSKVSSGFTAPACLESASQRFFLPLPALSSAFICKKKERQQAMLVPLLVGAFLSVVPPVVPIHLAGLVALT
ncbi:hypothetical protein SUGI_1010820 [Cryptomeria japonica]|nr:hypothetical protein SUGI_1010820 [Cryptomeria japonica]